MAGLRIIRYLRDLLDVVTGGGSPGDVLTLQPDGETWSAEPPAAVVTDHGSLGGLADDDHPQYHNDARGDARYWPLSTDLATQVELNAEAAARAAADSAHEADTTSVHGIPDTTVLATDSEVAAAVAAHVTDPTAAHAAEAIGVSPFGSIAATNVQDALEEVIAEASPGVTDHGALTGLADDDHPQYTLTAEAQAIADAAQADAEATAAAALAAHLAADVVDGDAAAGVLSGTYPSPGFAVDMATQAELDAHVNDAVDAHDASAISVLDAAGNFSAIEVEGALVELIAGDDAIESDLTDHLANAADAHDASAISFAPAGTIEATTVQAAIEEVAVEAGGAGAPTTADYLVGTTQPGLSAEIVVGATPGGELGGTWAAPIVDATHSGSSHAGVQAAAEATAQAALDAHTGDATDAHDASAISIVDAAGDFTATEVESALAELQTADEADEAALAAHLADGSDAHDASAVSFSPTGTISATDVQAAIAEVASEAGSSTAVGDILALYVFAR